MVKKTIYCDRCDKEVKSFEPKTLKHIGLNIVYTNGLNTDLCENCFDELMVWFYGVKDKDMVRRYDYKS